MSDQTVSDQIEETVVIEKKEEKKGKWTLEKAIAFMTRNGHSVGTKQVRLSDKGGLGALGCADYLRSKHKFDIFYPERK